MLMSHRNTGTDRMTEPAIIVENLCKAYRIGLKKEIHNTFVGAATSWLRAPLGNLRRLRRLNTFRKEGEWGGEEDIIWALKEVSFEVPEGEVLGIIGPNGAGKSTLLKILSRITEPTSGRAVINGRVASLLEVGTGFHPELTGRENVYLNGTILGMRKREIDLKFDQIVEFSGISKFIETPIKRYSSGMKVRLAFSVSAHLDAEILIIDEVLAVGDAEFRQKCTEKMREVAGKGRTVLFVSHNLASVQNLCGNGLLMKDGRIEHFGTSESVITSYLEGLATLSQTPLTHRMDRPGNGAARLLDLLFYGTEGKQRATFATAERIRIHVEYEVKVEPSSLHIVIHGTDIQGNRILRLDTRAAAVSVSKQVGVQRIACEIPKLPLKPGKYILGVAILADNKIADGVRGAGALTITEGDFFGTGVVLPSRNLPTILVEHHWKKGN